MKRINVLALCLIPLLSYAKDYRQEIMEHMINPCFKQQMKWEGLNPNDPELVDLYLENFGDQIQAEVEFLQNHLDSVAVSFSYDQRRELYRIGLNSCLDAAR